MTPDGGAAPGNHARVEREDGEVRLIVDGAVQSVGVGEDEIPRGYWPALIPARQPANALILGLGAGTAAHLLLRRWPDVRITGVDDDAEVLELARRQFGLATIGIAVLHSDARDYVRRCAQQFDLVIVDLFRGERIAEFATERAFIRRVRILSTPGGTVVWNLHRDRRGAILRRRVAAGLLPVARVLVGLNLVLHLRRRGYRLRR